VASAAGDAVLAGGRSGEGIQSVLDHLAAPARRNSTSA
jgi:hypothetical protein